MLLRLHLQSAGLEYVMQVSKSGIKIIVDDEVIILVVMRGFIDGVSHTTVYGICVILAPANQAMPQRITRWG